MSAVHSSRTTRTWIAVAFLAATFSLAAPSIAAAQVTSPDAKCRAAIDKMGVKYASTANKVVAGCVKARIKGAVSPDSCANPLDADSKGKLTKARAKLIDAVGGSKDKCATASAAALSAFQTGGCPSPGTVGAIGGFADVGACAVELTSDATAGDGMLAQLWLYVLDPDYAAMSGDSDVEKCASAMAKSISKLHTTAIKELGSCQRGLDKAGGAYDYACAGADPKDKIATAEQKLRDRFSKSCAALTDVQRRGLGSCDHDLDTPDCAVDAVLDSAAGLSATRFEYAGVCPVGLDLLRNGSAGGGFATDLDLGHTGLLHTMELPRGMRQALDISCADASCGQCDISLSCRDGACRCSGDFATICDEPFGPDTDDCAGAECLAYFGPPLPVNAGGTFSCLVTRLVADVTGSVDAGSGGYEVATANEVDFYVTGTQSRPCPGCDAGPTPQVGDAGICEGGNDPGTACTVDAVSATFGATSYDCQPLEAQAIGPLAANRTFSSDSDSLGFDLPCGSGDPAGCPCRLCADDPTIPCDSDQACVDAGALGPCSSDGAGVPTWSNSCDNLICDPGGVCSLGSEMYCDGFVKESGAGIIACGIDSDCTALNTECPGADCGTCSLVEARRCFNDPIPADQAFASAHGPVLTALYCASPTGTGIDAFLGLPGAARFTLDLEVVSLCPDGLTEWQLGGSNCP